MSPDSSARAASGEQQLGRVSPQPTSGGGDRDVMSPDNAASEVGSEYDEVDYDHDDDRDESEEGGVEEVNFAGVTSDLEVSMGGTRKRNDPRGWHTMRLTTMVSGVMVASLQFFPDFSAPWGVRRRGAFAPVC